MLSWWNVAALVLAYLLGSLSFAVIVSRGLGLADPRSYGSKNPGATNVLRSGNKQAAALTLLFDALKGLLPVLAVQHWGGLVGLDETSAAWVGLAAFIGHVWPVFFGFQGGKGVATAAGVLLGLNPWLGLATLATWAIIAYFFRYSSLASLVAAVFAPAYQALLWGPSLVTLALVLMSAILIWRHSANITKLLAGTESRLGQKAATGPSAAAHDPASSAGPAKGAGHGHGPER